MEHGVVVGRVSLLRRFPLRSAGGDLPGVVRVDASGLAHDRRWQLLDAAGTPLGARDVPAIASLTASVDDDALRVLAAARGQGGDPPDTGWVERLAGPGARLRDALAEGGAAHRDGAAVHVVSAGAAQAPGAPAGCDPGERANVVVELDAALARPGDERGWVGRRLRLQGPGTAPGPLLEVTRTPKRCLGVYAAVLEPGEVGVGAVVVLLDA